jgi:hopanoid biosynthesis associated radical SAM protein HpnH
MLEPLMRCNLACAGCGKIQHPHEILRRHLSPEQCFQAAEECRTPIISIPGGEPLLHPRIDEIVQGLVARKRFVYLCTNALKLVESLSRFRPSKFLAFSVHHGWPAKIMIGPSAGKESMTRQFRRFRVARDAGFRVTTNTTLFQDSDPERVRQLFDELMELGVEGMMVSPGYAYSKAPDQEHFLGRGETHHLFRTVFANAKRRWRFNQTPLFIQFLQGHLPLECTPWGSPTYNIFGWQRPCYSTG